MCSKFFYADMPLDHSKDEDQPHSKVIHPTQHDEKPMTDGEYIRMLNTIHQHSIHVNCIGRCIMILWNCTTQSI